MTHALCLIFEISCSRVSVLVSGIQLPSSQAAERLAGQAASKAAELRRRRGGRGACRGDLVCSFSFSDDGAEEAEAADRPAGTPTAHERQPAAAGVDGSLPCSSPTVRDKRLYRSLVIRRVV